MVIQQGAVGMVDGKNGRPPVDGDRCMEGDEGVEPPCGWIREAAPVSDAESSPRPLFSFTFLSFLSLLSLLSLLAFSARSPFLAAQLAV